MKLLTGEEEITTSDDGSVVLTNYRICINNKGRTDSYSNSIFLEDISSTEVRYISYSAILVAAVILLLAGIINLQEIGYNSKDIGNTCLIIGAIALLIYFFSRKHVVSITPNGGKPINVIIKGINKEQVTGFVYKIQQAKLFRTNK